MANYVIENAPDLMSREFDREGVKLHATLMNSRFPVAMAKDAAAREGRGAESNWRRRDYESQWKVPARQSFAAIKIFKVCTSTVALHIHSHVVHTVPVLKMHCS